MKDPEFSPRNTRNKRKKKKLFSFFVFFRVFRVFRGENSWFFFSVFSVSPWLKGF